MVFDTLVGSNVGSMGDDADVMSELSSIHQRPDIPTRMQRRAIVLNLPAAGFRKRTSAAHRSKPTVVLPPTTSTPTSQAFVCRCGTEIEEERQPALFPAAVAHSLHLLKRFRLEHDPLRGACNAVLNILTPCVHRYAHDQEAEPKLPRHSFSIRMEKVLRLGYRFQPYVSQLGYLIVLQSLHWGSTTETVIRPSPSHLSPAFSVLLDKTHGSIIPETSAQVGNFVSGFFERGQDICVTLEGKIHFG
ncbi:uncharacterized protein BDR25DRAFT_363124 [Lindgomyces ingoldianus]|uniref:Uncharacterized protein n=1 Tax=Lindgomyces ingoldianus TaxID=673940 RepID=A0ACB6Q8M5_9PLEO|nr:uncharacterized protein BDR25DRAFT_363124 [Lindgomyces ingoldianus]KAF2463230.1 hypothetical protein BDR25DRAFT_363124 [Lindgomyces ingoldianus]